MKISCKPVFIFEGLLALSAGILWTFFPENALSQLGWFPQEEWSRSLKYMTAHYFALNGMQGAILLLCVPDRNEHIRVPVSYSFLVSDLLFFMVLYQQVTAFSSPPSVWLPLIMPVCIAFISRIYGLFIDRSYFTPSILKAEPQASAT